jgi:hypothetical protein
VLCAETARTDSPCLAPNHGRFEIFAAENPEETLRHLENGGGRDLLHEMGILGESRFRFRLPDSGEIRRIYLDADLHYFIVLEPRTVEPSAAPDARSFFVTFMVRDIESRQTFWVRMPYRIKTDMMQKFFRENEDSLDDPAVGESLSELSRRYSVYVNRNAIQMAEAFIRAHPRFTLFRTATQPFAVTHSGKDRKFLYRKFGRSNDMEMLGQWILRTLNESFPEVDSQAYVKYRPPQSNLIFSEFLVDPLYFLNQREGLPDPAPTLKEYFDDLIRKLANARGANISLVFMKRGLEDDRVVRLSKKELLEIFTPPEYSLLRAFVRNMVIHFLLGNIDFIPDNGIVRDDGITNIDLETLFSEPYINHRMLGIPYLPTERTFVNYLDRAFHNNLDSVIPGFEEQKRVIREVMMIELHRFLGELAESGFSGLDAALDRIHSRVASKPGYFSRAVFQSSNSYGAFEFDPRLGPIGVVPHFSVKLSSEWIGEILEKNTAVLKDLARRFEGGAPEDLLGYYERMTDRLAAVSNETISRLLFNRPPVPRPSRPAPVLEHAA